MSGTEMAATAYEAVVRTSVLLVEVVSVSLDRTFAP
jgi:hypothetical protein